MSENRGLDGGRARAFHAFHRETTLANTVLKKHASRSRLPPYFIELHLTSSFTIFQTSSHEPHCYLNLSHAWVYNHQCYLLFYYNMLILRMTVFQSLGHA
jgi:hypothetical protein